MLLKNICPPAILYIVFTLTHIMIDMFKNLYNLAFIKFMVMIIFTILLNFLCKKGLSIVSWFIVFIPFIMMTIITSLVLFTFGLSPSQGSLDYNVKYPGSRKMTRFGQGGHGQRKYGSNRYRGQGYWGQGYGGQGYNDKGGGQGYLDPSGDSEQGYSSQSDDGQGYSSQSDDGQDGGQNAVSWRRRKGEGGQDYGGQDYGGQDYGGPSDGQGYRDQEYRDRGYRDQGYDSGSGGEKGYNNPAEERGRNENRGCPGPATDGFVWKNRKGHQNAKTKCPYTGGCTQMIDGGECANPNCECVPTSGGNTNKTPESCNLRKRDKGGPNKMTSCIDSGCGVSISTGNVFAKKYMGQYKNEMTKMNSCCTPRQCKKAGFPTPPPAPSDEEWNGQTGTYPCILSRALTKGSMQPHTACIAAVAAAKTNRKPIDRIAKCSKSSTSTHAYNICLDRFHDWVIT